jgi:subtilase family serine protease
VSTVPDQLAEGYVATFRATVRNVGTAASPPGSPDIVFLLDGVPVSWSRSDTSSLRPGEERLYVADGGPVSATWTATRGRHRLVAIVDAGDRVAEPSERNNSATTAFRIR